MTLCFPVVDTLSANGIHEEDDGAESPTEEARHKRIEEIERALMSEGADISLLRTLNLLDNRITGYVKLLSNVLDDVAPELCLWATDRRTPEMPFHVP